MSRIGKLPVKVPDKVNVLIHENIILVKGPKGELSKQFPNVIKIIQDNNSIKVLPTSESNDAQQLYGTYRSIIHNMITGVTEGFKKKLELP